jgi:hypothetical protein
MSLPDYVQEVLDYLDTNWDTNNYSPQPTLVDGDEMRLNAGGRARSLDVLNANIITVDSAPTGTNTAIGTGFDFKVRRGVSVEIEGYHQDGGGQIADKDDFNALVTEARRAILAERKFPVGEMTWLTIEQEDDESAAASHNDANYFRYLFDVWFMGYESLP